MKLLSPARLMLEATSAKSRRVAKQQLVRTPTGAEGGEQSLKRRVALIPIVPVETAPIEGEQEETSSPPIPSPSRKSTGPPKCPETPDISGSSGSNSDTISLLEELRVETSPSEITESDCAIIGVRPPDSQEPKGRRGGKTAQLGRGAKVGPEGEGENSLAVGMVAQRQAASKSSLRQRRDQPSEGGMEAVGDMGSDVVCTSTTPPVATVSSSMVPKVRARGRNHKTPREGSQAEATASDLGVKPGRAAAESQLAPVGRRGRHTVMMPYPEVRTRRSARIAAWAQAKQELCAPVGGADTVSEEEERDSETDQARGETSEAERDGDSDINPGEAGGVPKIAHA